VNGRSGWARSRREQLQQTLDNSTSNCRHGIYEFVFAKGFVTSRAHSMKRSTTGLRVRFFSVKTTTRNGRAGKMAAQPGSKEA
jgi:hypothetical protein